MELCRQDIKKRETMNSRERVLKAINHEPVDRVPIDLGMYGSTGISAFAYWNLREYLGLSTENIEIVDVVQLLPRVQEDILRRFHCDCMMLQPRWKNSQHWNPRDKYDFLIPQVIQPELFEDESWIVRYKGGKMRLPKGGYFFDGDWLIIEDREEDDQIKFTAREAERIYKETDYFTSHQGFGAFFAEMDVDWQCKMITDEEEIVEGNERMLKDMIRVSGKIIDTMGRYIQGIWVGSDLGSQNGPLCRPSLYDELCAPFLEKFCSFIHSNSDLKILMHSCGSIKPFIPTIINCGVDVLNPIQISAANMDPQTLKKEFGNKIAFWGGGCDTQNILNNGSQSDVKENVQTLINIFKPGSGFIFNQVHNIMGDIKSENIVAMLDTAYEESFY